MNRTTIVASLVLLWGPATAVAQAPTPPPAKVPEADPIGSIVASIQAAEQRLKSARVELSTEVHLPAELSTTTRGVLSVLRGEQASLHTVFEFTMGGGFRGRFESAQTSNGIVVYEDNPAFGEVHVRIDPVIVADLQWAGEVLHRTDLWGMGDGRAQSPLGSEMLVGLQRAFEFVVAERKDRDGEPGTWLLGTRRANLGDQDPDLPLADKVEVFVRQRDQAVLEVTHKTADVVSQRIVVTKVEVDVALAASDFHVEGRGQRLRDVRQNQPMWESIEQTLRQAESRSEAEAAKEPDPEKRGPVLRPSRR